jgi:hypothetical protein
VNATADVTAYRQFVTHHAIVTAALRDIGALM